MGVPNAVVAEVEFKRGIGSYLSELGQGASVSRSSVDQLDPLVATWDLGQGESEVITLGREISDATVVLDDLQARKCASLLQVPVAGSIGLLLMAKKDGYIQVVRPEIDKLLKAGMRINTDFLKELYKRIGE